MGDQANNTIRPAPWFGVIRQAPAPRLEIFLPGAASSSKPDYVYSAAERGGTWSKLLGYTFSESVEDMDGAFSFTIENGTVREDTTAFDVLAIRSVVKIFEGNGSYPSFVGIIRRRQLGVAMTSAGIKRTITLSGKSVASCVAEFALSLDLRIHGVTTVEDDNIKFKDKLLEVRTLRGFIQVTWNYFYALSKKLNEALNGRANIAVADIIKTFMGNPEDPEPSLEHPEETDLSWVTPSGTDQTIHYNISNVLINQGNNTIVDIWRHILPNPAYEVFSYCDKADGKPKIMIRQVPFGYPEEGNLDWSALPRYVISPSQLTSYDLTQSDEEVYTAFYAYLIGSVKDRSFFIRVNTATNTDIAAYEQEKVKTYGFRPLEIDLNGYDRHGNTENQDDEHIQEMIRKLNKRLRYWYGRLDDMYSGSLTLVNDFNHDENNPRVGCRAQFMGAEFYIERADHTWRYGGAPTIKLTISRGMVYNEDGAMKEKIEGILKNPGGYFRELEER